MMPCDYSKYPDNWKTEIVPAVKARAGNRCEWCAVANYAVGYRDMYGVFHAEFSPGTYREAREIQTRQRQYERSLAPGDRTAWVVIVLTVAHVHDPGPMNADMGNLKLLCQKCHNALDAPTRAKNAAATRRQKRNEATGQIDLFGSAA